MFVYRDPFARIEIHKTRDYGPNSCSFCGSAARTTPNKIPFTFIYFTQSDGSNKLSRIPGNFCSVGCMRAYHAA